MAAKKNEDRPRQIGLRMESRRVPRQHCPILKDGAAVGEITSGTFSPTLEAAIAIAYVTADAAAEGQRLEVDIRGKSAVAQVVALPFYKRKSP